VKAAVVVLAAIVAIAGIALAVDILSVRVAGLRTGIAERLAEVPGAAEASGLAKADGLLAGYAPSPDTARRLKLLGKAGAAVERSGSVSALVVLPMDALAGDALTVAGQARNGAVSAVGALTLQRNIDKVWKAVGKYDDVRQAAEDARVLGAWGACLTGVAKAWAGYDKARQAAEKLAAQEP
jgi:hypothetical protein